LEGILSTHVIQDEDYDTLQNSSDGGESKTLKKRTALFIDK
jgi:hypothetical protein